ncbi:AmmeMemoRadiSam system protein B [Desulfovibrio sp. OttesenSCG-928-M14]|nr:AmmeMemoRadiSam system protein B [Desulfovibrio sp. OttesenSCG-928-M14]
MTPCSPKNILMSVALVVFVATAGAAASFTYDERPFPVFYESAESFRRAIAQAGSIAPLQERVNGITLPHHLLAADLIVGGAALLRNQQYERIIILSPDHFRRGATPFSVPERDFLTPLGLVKLDRQGAEVVLRNPGVSVSSLFSHEHGVRAILPFIAHYFPEVPVLPLALRISSGKKDWDSLLESLRPLLTEKTLLVQSTDFSHYLPWQEAIAHDKATLRVLASGKPELVETLHQPRHLDSRAAQYLQMAVQAAVYNARPTVIANVNSSEYLPAGEQTLAETTSYIVQIYSADHLPPLALPGKGAASGRYFFAGDFFTGRHLRQHLENPEKRRHFVQRVRQVTTGAPLIVNVEGVLRKECPPISLFGESVSSGGKETLPPPEWRLCMPKLLTLDLLEELAVVAVGLANNHSRDYGPEAYASMKKALQERGIAVLEQGETVDFKEFSLTAFTDLDNSRPQKWLLLKESDLSFLSALSQKKPLFAFIHWGTENSPIPDQREKDLANLLVGRGVSLVIGHHPHRAGKLESNMNGIVAWSLGNFLFDQPGPQADGALLELTFFPQGTFWVRQICVGNLYTFLAHDKV